MIELNPTEWKSSDRALIAAHRTNRLIGAVCWLLAFSVSFYIRTLWMAPARHDHSVPPPGNYEWTPEHGLKPLTAGFPATQPRQ
jgi:hypothetical protein